MKLELTRQYYKQGTNGVLLLNGVILCATIELPWHDNQPRISCVPEGNYLLVKRYSPHFKWHLQLAAVPGRDLILIHPANNAMKELRGCIAPVSLITAPGQGARSVKAFQKITSLVFPVIEKKESVLLTIKKYSNE